MILVYQFQNSTAFYFSYFESAASIIFINFIGTRNRSLKSMKNHISIFCKTRLSQKCDVKVVVFIFYNVKYYSLWVKVTISFFKHLGIESLPYDLQRNFSLQRDLDQRAHGKWFWVILRLFQIVVYLQIFYFWPL